MRLEQLKRLSEAPESGQYLIYTRKNVLFAGYASIDEVTGKVADADILEIHLFDKDREYRAISSKSKRFADGLIEHVADFKESDADTYKDVIVLDNGKGNITVINHLKYDEVGMSSIDDFRMVMGGEGNAV